MVVIQGILGQIRGIQVGVAVIQVIQVVVVVIQVGVAVIQVVQEVGIILQNQKTTQQQPQKMINRMEMLGRQISYKKQHPHHREKVVVGPK
jgi:uncharacterized membrane protein (Fun14 family)